MRIGIDFGGTKIEAAALDASGAFIARIREPNPGTYDAAISLVADLITRVEAEAGPAHSVGLAIPGSLSPRTGLIRNANSIYLNGRCFGDDLEATLGRPVRLANDANCLALSESADGAGVGAASLFGVILGTGCGGGIVVDGRVVAGPNRVAGEWGHTPLPWPREDEYPPPPHWCGQAGCLEMYLAGPGLAQSCGASNGAEVVRRAEAGDPAATLALDRHADRLARLVAQSFGLTRLTDSRRTAILAQLPSDVRLDDTEQFLWPSHEVGYRRTPEGVDRPLEHVALREIGAAMVALTAASAGIGTAELHRATLAVFGGLAGGEVMLGFAAYSAIRYARSRPDFALTWTLAYLWLAVAVALPALLALPLQEGTDYFCINGIT